MVSSSCNGIVRKWALFLLIAESFGIFMEGFVSTRPPTFVQVAGPVRHGVMPLCMSIPTPLETLTSGLASIVRIPNGVGVDTRLKKITEGDSIRIAKLYDIENNAECRRVREKITELDLVVETIIPSTKNSKVMTSNGVLPPSKIPRMVVVEEASGVELVLDGSMEIVEYLEETFLDNSTPLAMLEDESEGSFNIPYEITGPLTSLLRLGRGNRVVTAALLSTCPRPQKKLILYNYEGNQFCRLVREVLTELDLQYEMRPTGKQSPRRDELASISVGYSSQCPHLLDPNTDVSMKESGNIIEYLYKSYADWTPPNELLSAASFILTPLLKPLYAFIAPLQAGGGSFDSTNKIEEVNNEVNANAVVVYTYKLSPFCSEATALLRRLNIPFTEISIGLEWIPGLIADAEKRAALGKMTGQTSLPHIFVGGTSLGGLFSGTPGVIPALEQDMFKERVEAAIKKQTKQLTT